MSLLPFGSLLLALFACSSDPSKGTLEQNVGQSFAACKAPEIKFLASKHNFMLAFEPCGINNFAYFAWSPDGKHLYFQLSNIPYVMNAEDKRKPTTTLSMPSPLGSAAWLSNSRLAAPIGPAESEDPLAPERIVIYDIEQSTAFFLDLVVGAGTGAKRLEGATDLVRGDDANELYFLAHEQGSEDGHVYRVSLSDNTVAQAFDWATKPVTSFSLTPSLNVAVMGDGERVSVYDIANGELHGTYGPAKRGTLNADGRWLALEHDGEPVSVFYQRAWDELSERAREREVERAKRFTEDLPESYQTTVRPPTLSFVDLNSGKRFMLTSVYGQRFQWYEPTPYYGSLMLWGFEGKELKRNVLLGNFGDRLKNMELGRDTQGIIPFEGGTAEAVVPRAVDGVPAGDEPITPAPAAP